MYSISINKQVIAVSEDIRTAMKSARKVVADYLGVQNENFIEYITHGVEYLPWSDSASASFTYKGEDFDVFITYIKTI